MPGVSCSSQAKAEFDELKPDDATQAEFFDELLAAYRRDNGEIVNVDELAERVDAKVASNVEIAAYRGVVEALNNHGGTAQLRLSDLK